MDWFPLTLICAFCIAAADATAKRYFSDYTAIELVLLRFAVPAVLLLPVCIYFPLPAVPAPFYGLMAILIVFELLAMLFYMLAIRDSPLHLTLPYLAFTPVFNIVTGNLFLNEHLSLQGISGIGLIFVGAYLLNIKSLSEFSMRDIFSPLHAFMQERGSRLMLMTAAIYSITSVLGKRAMQYADPMSFGAFYYTVIGFSAIVLFSLLRPRGLRVLGRRPLPMLVLGGLMAIMVITHFLAIAQVEVAYMMSVKRTSLLFGIVLGALLFKERNLSKNLAAGSIMVFGVALILL